MASKKVLQQQADGLLIALDAANARIQALTQEFAPYREIKDIDARVASLKSTVEKLEAEAVRLYEEIKKSRKIKDLDAEISEQNQTVARISDEIEHLKQDEEKSVKQYSTIQKKLARAKQLLDRVQHAASAGGGLFETELQEVEALAPSMLLKLHYMDMKDLRKAFRGNQKQIDELLKAYSGRYTTKANQSIYQLMVIALQAELQNILYALKYEKLDDAIETLKRVTRKYLAIASDGNQSIAGTITRFIGEIEYLFINAIKIEYNYYVKKEQARQEQLAIREQMRQEAEERKALALEKKRVEAEEEKFKVEIERVSAQLVCSSEGESFVLKARILELEGQLSSVAIEKEKITSLQNGRAGTVYVISNLGAFGDGIFKIGMTRRLVPQDRISELGSASVPFSFDVHSFIFSDDAVGLETSLHQRLTASRVNKVNRRKEFFYSTINDLEALVLELDPTAEFNRTMAAEEYHQSQSTDEVYSDDYEDDINDDE